MSQGFTKLQELDIQKISEQTHISKQHIQALMDENFKALNKVQFLGFISILERDYKLDLSDLKEKGLKFYGESASFATPSVFIEKRPKKSSKGLYILISLLIFVVAIYYSIDSDTSNADINATQIESVTQEIESLVENNISEMNAPAFDANQSSLIQDEEGFESNVNAATDVEAVAAPVKESAQLVKSLKIIAKTKLWFGYIELGTENKTQKVFSGELDLDPNKNWLLLFGHNNVEIELNGKTQEFQKDTKIQFLYKDGELTQTTLEEFRKLNKGRKW
jgi:hypothetical protein